MMKYKLLNFQRSALLHTYLYDLYEIRTADKGFTYSTAPNGIIGLSFTLTGQSKIYYDQQWNNCPLAHTYGLIQKPHLIAISPYFTEIAIGFKPYFLQLLLNEAMENVVDTTGIDSFYLFKKPSITQLQDSLFGATSDEEIIAAVELFVRQHLKPQKADERLLLATELIAQNRISRVSALADELNISTTTLRNLFREKIGLSPKALIRLTRIRTALKQANTVNLTSLAYDLGYFDQSHFIHDFKNCFGLAPSQYFQNEALAFDFYNFGRWRGDTFGIIKS